MITLTIPSFVPHGGIRVILEWANRLSKYDSVSLFCRTFHPGRTALNWFDLNPDILITNSITKIEQSDILIICSPHDIELEKLSFPKKKFIFLQMLEHLFRPGNFAWATLCSKTYSSKLTLICISEWNKRYILEKYPNRGPIYCVGNGVNLDHFPIVFPAEKISKKIVLVEGWDALNPSKDSSCVGPQVAARLKQDGYYISAYNQKPARCFRDVPDEFYVLPDLETLNFLYSNATILIKATQYDARSCSPMEAMTKGTVTARAIIEGDDDLHHFKNCYRVSYDVDKLYYAALTLLKDDTLRNILACNCISYVQTYTWDYWMEKIVGILEIWKN